MICETRGGAGAHQPFRKFLGNVGNFGKNMNIWNISRSNRKDYSSIFFFGVPRVIIVNSLIYISNIVVNPSYMLLNVSTLRCKYWLIKWKGLSEYRKYEVYLDFLQVIIFEKKKAFSYLYDISWILLLLINSKGSFFECTE